MSPSADLPFVSLFVDYVSTVLLHDSVVLPQYNSTASSIAAQWSTASGESKSQQADRGGGGGIVGRRLSSTELEEDKGAELVEGKGEGGKEEKKGGGLMDGLFHHGTEGAAASASEQHREESMPSDIDTSLLTAEERWILRTGGE